MTTADAALDEADLYLRLSKDRDGATALDRQEIDLRAWAATEGVTIRKVHVDRISAFDRAVRRPGFDDACAALAAGEVPTLAVWKLDRLSRQGIGQVGTVLDAVPLGSRIVFLKDGLDTSQPQARILIALLSEMARSESENTSTRVRNSKAHQRRLGQWPGGRPPLGMRRRDDGKLEPDPEHADTTREIVRRLGEGESARAVCLDLNARGVPARQGGEWNTSSVVALVRSAAIAGLMPARHRDGKGPHRLTSARLNAPYRDPETSEVVVIGEGVVSEADRQRALAQIATRTDVMRPRGARKPSKRLLTGLTHCDLCGRPMSSSPLSYTCRVKAQGGTCPGASIRVDPLDDWVIQRWMTKLTTAEPGDPFLEAVADRWVRRHDPESLARREELTVEIADEESALGDLEAARYERREFVGADALARYARMHARVADRLEGLRAQLADLPIAEADISPLLDPIQVRAAWSRATLLDRRDLLSLAIARVSVNDRGGRGVRIVPADRATIAWVGDDTSVAV